METLIIHATQGEGKTKALPRLLEKFGARAVVDAWDGRSALPAGALVLTNSASANLACLGGARVLTLAEALA